MKITFLLFFSLLIRVADAMVWQVGPTRTYTFCSQVAPFVQDGDTVEIDPAVYVNDSQVHWNANDLWLVGTGGRPRLEAGSIIALDSVNGKGIFVISGNNVKVENIEFALAAVPDHNGAGIRQQGANLHVVRCRFDGNEMGLLSGNIPNCTTTIEFCEFVNGGSLANPGYQHNVYINHIDTLVFRYNYSHDAIAEGHELKSRATYNVIMYNRIANESTVDSRTIDLPNGGTCVLVGNVIEQGVNSANSNLLGYGLEGLSNAAPHDVWICSNTFINKKPTGSFIHVANGTGNLFLRNNILAGAHTGGYIVGTPTILDTAYNLTVNPVSGAGFADPLNFDYHLTSGSVARDAGVTVTTSVLGYSLEPVWMYRDTCDVEPRVADANLDIGAFEYVSPAGFTEPAAAALLLYPNPCHQTLWITADAGEMHAVYDIAGQCITTGIGTMIDTSGFIPGVYLVMTGKGRGRFVVE